MAKSVRRQKGKGKGKGEIIGYMGETPVHFVADIPALADFMAKLFGPPPPGYKPKSYARPGEKLPWQ